MKKYHSPQLFLNLFRFDTFAIYNLKKMKKQILTFPIILFFFISIFEVTNAQQWGEYTLYATQNGTSAYLIDTNNTTYHSWTFSSSAKTGYSTYLMPGGTLVRTVAKQGNQLIGGGMTGQVQKVNWSGTVIWDYVHSSSTYCLHHDVCPLPNGNVLMISYEVKTAAQAVQAGCSQSITIWAEKIIEVEPTGSNTGNIVWEWHVWDHLCQNYNATKDNYVTSIVEHPELININYNTQKDWMHANGIDYNETLDQIVFSSHNLNEIYVIDHSTTTSEATGHTGGNSGKGGDILYRWGNPQVYQAGNASNKILNVAHDAHWIPQDCPNAGYLVAFNNNGISNNQSSIDMVSPPYDGYNYSITPGSAFLPLTYTLRHNCNGHSNNMGNSQQLPNGNMLVCIAQAGYIYEIGPTGTLLWSKSVSGSVPMAFRYSACYVSGESISVVAESSETEVCPGSSVQLNATATGGNNYTYNWYSIPVGFISTLPNPVVTPLETTIYSVTVISGGCSASSSVQVLVYPSPETPTISQIDNTLYCSLASSYQWFFEGSIIEGATLQTLLPEQNGAYQVQVGNEDGCLSAYSEIFNYVTSEINEKFGLPDLLIIPNPVKNIFHLQGNLVENRNFKVWITDPNGRIILMKENQHIFDLTNQRNGVYYLFVDAEGDGNIISLKIILMQ
jgi:hypothetical protein